MPDLTNVRERLAPMVAANVDPVLSNDDLDRILGDAVVADSDGRHPHDTAWVGAWDLHGAAAAAWREKAGRASDRVTLNSPGATLNRQQLFEHCLRMADAYAARPALIISATGDLSLVEAASMTVRAHTIYTAPGGLGGSGSILL